ncbi:MAG: signal peptidase I [Clostridia bacterium]|nr:signal peptidase I [Clostridia bacterium]MBQ1821170.1 signal peptidase I [Clostridia bacterium]
MEKRLIDRKSVTKMTVGRMRREAEKRNESMEGGVLWRALDFGLYLIMIVLIMFAVRTVLIDPVRVDGRSMLDTLVDGQVMLVDRTAYTFQKPARGDIVLCYYPDDYYTSQELPYATRVKRVVAVAGDTIETVDGVLYVNGERIEEPYLTPERIGGQFIRPQTIPEGCVYVLGDNRAVSRDSRYDTVGSIPLYRVVGKVRMVIYPFKNAHLI